MSNPISTTYPTNFISFHLFTKCACRLDTHYAMDRERQRGCLFVSNFVVAMMIPVEGGWSMNRIT